MSIKTKYVKEIFSGEKVYEFRKKSIGYNNLNKKVFIYSSKGDKKIVGYVIFDKIIKGSSMDMVMLSGIKSIKNYFGDSKECYAFHISEYHLFDEFISLDELKNKYNFVVPQSYRYINNKNLITRLEQLSLKVSK